VLHIFERTEKFHEYHYEGTEHLGTVPVIPYNTINTIPQSIILYLYDCIIRLF